MKKFFQNIGFLFLCLSAFQAANAQSTQVTGIVYSGEDNSTIIGATIVIVGEDESLGTISDFDGSYTIEVPNSDATLRFSYVGMETLEVPLSGRTSLDVTLQPEASLIDEVVVVGYGTQKRSKISGAVSVISSDEITETPILRTEQALQGRTAGVQVTQNSGSPGSTLSVRIRGIGTINGSDPLYIVDGIQVTNLDFLNPNDIETINILKDAASAAIYGSRGANGVVLITTKTGSKDRDGEISYDAYYGVQSPWKKMHLLNAREYAIIQNEMYINAGLTPPTEFENPDALGEGTDWQDAIFTTAPITSHQLSLSGGGEKSQFLISGNYFLQDGIVGGDKAQFERYTARLNASHQLKDWLTLGTNIGGTRFTRNALPENNEFATPLIRALNMDPITPVRKFDGTFAYSPYADTDIVNPVNQIEQTFDEWTSSRLLAAVYADFQISENIKFKSTYGLDMTYATQDLFFGIYDLSYDTIVGDAPAGEKRQNNSVVYNVYDWTNWQWENVLTYNNTFAEKHVLEGVLGNTLRENTTHVSGGANSNLPSNDPDDALISNTIDPIESMSSFEYASESALLSYFGRVNYEYDGKYLFTGTFRADGSSRFGANNRFGYFPSVSAGWIISNESFFTIDEISSLKLRASWGRNGNDNIGDYSFSTIVFAGQNYSFGTNEDITSGAVATTSANPDLKWETITQTDIGLDVELFDGKINFITDYYIKNTSDMLFAAPIPATSGTQAPIQNVASIQNRGLEFFLEYREREREFKYGVSGNISFLNSEVTGLGQGGEPVLAGYVQSANSLATKTDVGQPVAAFFGYVTDGIFQNQAEVEAHAFQSENTSAGDIRFVDLNQDGVINADDRTYIGDPTPDFIYGMNFNCEYKGFDMSLFLQGVYGNDIYNGTVRYDFSYVNRPISVLNRWTGEGTSNDEPRVSLTDPNQNARISDRFVEDGSFLRLKNIQIGYNVPQKFLDKAKLKRFRVYLSAQNLFTITKYSGLDPEIGTIGSSLEIGIDRGFYPQSRTFLGGIQITL